MGCAPGGAPLWAAARAVADDEAGACLRAGCQVGFQVSVTILRSMFVGGAPSGAPVWAGARAVAIDEAHACLQVGF